MRKWILTLIIMFMIPLALAIEECQDVITPSDVPCMLRSSWEFHPCVSYNISVFNSSGNLTQVYVLGDFGVSGRCNATWNISTLGSYTLNWTSGDSGHISIEEDENMILGLVFGAGIVAGLLFLLSFKLDEEHFILKLLLILTGVTVILLIPASLIIDTDTVFWWITISFFVSFWLYVIGYFVYWILKKLGLIVSGNEYE